MAGGCQIDGVGKQLFIVSLNPKPCLEFRIWGLGFRVTVNPKSACLSHLRSPIIGNNSVSSEWHFLVVEPSKIIFLIESTIPIKEDIILL